MKKEIQVVQSEKEVPIEVLAEAITSISKGVKQLLNGPLREEAVVLLIVHASPSIGSCCQKKPINATMVRAVLDGIASLESKYVKPAK